MDTEKIANDLCKDENFWKDCNNSLMIHMLVSTKALCKGGMRPDTKAEGITKAAVQRACDNLDADTINEINKKIIERSANDEHLNNIKQNLEKFKQSFIKCYEATREDSSLLATKTKHELKNLCGDILNTYVCGFSFERKMIYDEWFTKLLDPNKLYNEHKNEIDERMKEIKNRSETAAEKAEEISKSIPEEQKYKSK